MTPDAIAAYGDALATFGIGVIMTGMGLFVLVAVVGLATIMIREEWSKR